MRIVQIANFYGPRSGGIRTTMQQLGHGYRGAGHESIIVVPGATDSNVHAGFGRVITLAAPELPRSGGYRVITDVDRVRRLLDDLAPDRLEVSDRLSLRSLGLWARANDVPAVMWAHERIDGVLRAWLPDAIPVEGLADRWNRSTMARFDRVVCTTNFARQEFDRIGWRNVAYVPLGVDLELFSPNRYDDDLRTSLIGPQDDVLLVMCIRLSKEKRPELALDTLVELRQAGIAASLVVAGAGPMLDQLTKAARRIPATPGSFARAPIKFLGHVSDRSQLAGILASADVVLAPGPIETFGLAALEAMASGTPVVANASSALREIVEPGGIAANGTGLDFADAVMDLLRRPEGARRRAARSRAQEFPWSRSINAMLNVHGLPVPEAPLGHLPVGA